MPQPPAYTRFQNFTDWQAANPGDVFAGPDLDGEFNRLKATTDAVRTNMALLQRDDGALANGAVTPDSLSAATLTLVGDWNPRGDWVTATSYAVRDMVTQGGTNYVALTAHTSGTFNTDLSAGKWQALGQANSAAAVSVSPAGNIAATNVQMALEELDAEKQPLDADLTAIAALTSAADKVPYATGAGTWALATLTSAGRTLIAAASAALQRTALGLGALATLDTVGAAQIDNGAVSAAKLGPQVVNGQSAATAASDDYLLIADTDDSGNVKKALVSDLTGGGSLGLPSGALVAYGGTSAPSGWLLCYGQEVSRTDYAALYAVVGTVYGVGDGSTTFNVPDLRGRVIAGQDDMGGTSANRLTGLSGGVDGDVLGGTGGAESVTLTTNHLPASGLTLPAYLTGSGASPGYLAIADGNAPAAQTTGNMGGGGAHNNVQPTAILNYIIKT